MATSKKKRTLSKTKKVTSPKASAQSAKDTVAQTTPIAASESTSTTHDPAHRPINFRTLHKWLAIIYAVQAVAIVVVSASKSIAIFSSFLTQNSLLKDGPLVPATQHIFDINITALVVAMLLSMACVHGVLAQAAGARRYDADRAAQTGIFRWMNIGISSVFSMILIALLSGISEATALLMIAVLVVVKIGLFYSNHQSARKLFIALGLLAGSAAWFAVLFTGLSTAIFGSDHVPGYLYGIYATALVGSAVQLRLVFQAARRQGVWASYEYTDRGIMLTTLVIQTALIWQIFAGVLRP